jgi:uncharacterized protein (DUF362 family)
VRAAQQVMAAMRIELDDENAVFKPNVTVGEKFANPDSGITTHPGFIHGLIDYVRAHGLLSKRGAYILEDPRNTNDNEARHWQKTGFPEVARATGAKLRTPKTYTCVKKPVPDPIVFSSLNVSRLAVAPNTALFNIPKLKTHNLSITTLCMKNLMGAVNVYDRHYCGQAWQDLPDEVRDDPRPREVWMDRTLHERWQRGLAQRLVDTAKVIQPKVNIVEGVVGRDGTGFNRGTNYALGLVVAGINMVAVDSVASYLMGFDPQQLIYLRMAAEAGLGIHDLGHLRIYTAQNGALVRCADVAALRAEPPLRVISNIVDEV